MVSAEGTQWVRQHLWRQMDGQHFDTSGRFMWYQYFNCIQLQFLQLNISAQIMVVTQIYVSRVFIFHLKSYIQAFPNGFLMLWPESNHNYLIGVRNQFGNKMFKVKTEQKIMTLIQRHSVGI